MASSIAFLWHDVQPVIRDNAQATDATGLPLWAVTLDVRTASGTKYLGHSVQIAASNGAGIRQGAKAYAHALDDAENVVKIKTPQAILALVGQPVDLQFNPVLDWDTVP